jgi:hypothetical protein
MRLLGFIPEYVGEKTTQGNVKKYIRDNVCDITNKALQYSHTPDAVFALETEACGSQRDIVRAIVVKRGGTPPKKGRDSPYKHQH